MSYLSLILYLREGASLDLHRKIFKGHNSVKNVDVVTVLCTSSDGDLYLYIVS